MLRWKVVVSNHMTFFFKTSYLYSKLTSRKIVPIYSPFSVWKFPHATKILCFIWRAENIFYSFYISSACSTVWPSRLTFVRRMDEWKEGWMEGRKVNLFSLSKYVPHLRFSNQRLLREQPLREQNEYLTLFLYLSCNSALRSPHWGHSPLFLPLVWDSALVLSNVLQVEVTMRSLALACRLTTFAFLPFLRCHKKHIPKSQLPL